MRYNIDEVIFPQDFKYIEVIRKGKPAHEQFDSFYLKHPPMELSRRAKIFAPFDALKGFNDAVASKEIHYEERKDLNEEDVRDLDIKLNTLYKLTVNSREAGRNNVKASVTYFVPCDDINNEAYMVLGTYNSITGTVKKVDRQAETTVTIDSTVIPIADISCIDIISCYIRQDC